MRLHSFEIYESNNSESERKEIEEGMMKEQGARWNTAIHIQQPEPALRWTTSTLSNQSQGKLMPSGAVADNGDMTIWSRFHF